MLLKFVVSCCTRFPPVSGNSIIYCLYMCKTEPLQNLRARFGTCKAGLSPAPSSFIFLIFQGDTSVVVLFALCFGVEFLCCLNLMYVFIVLVKFGLVRRFI